MAEKDLEPRVIALEREVHRLSVWLHNEQQARFEKQWHLMEVFPEGEARGQLQAELVRWAEDLGLIIPW